jgi:GT2 family glycosyltransferase
VKQDRPAAPRLSIVFLNFNREMETRETVNRLLDLTAQRNDIEIIAVDNGSDDGTAEYIESLATRLVPILRTDNQGIAGYNDGFDRARGDYLLVLDDDSCPANEQTVEVALQLLDSDREIGIVACRIETPAGHLQWSWHLPENTEAPGASMAFVGCGFFIRRALFRDIGWYPAHFFLYQNEMEVAIRTRLKGKRIVYEPTCRVIHRGEPSQRPNWRRIFFPTRNTLWLLRRYFPPLEASYLVASRLIIGFARAVMFGQLKAYFRAAREGLSEPLDKQVLPLELRREFRPFWRQNSILHQLLRRA